MLDLPAHISRPNWSVRTDRAEVVGTFTFEHPDAPPDVWHPTSSPYTLYERIRKFRRLKPVRRQTALPVVHQKIVLKNVLSARPWGTQYGSGHNLYPANFWVVAEPQLVLDLCAGLTESEIHNLALEFANTLGEQIPTQVDIANFTWELREIAELIPRLEGVLSKDIASLHLNNKFGWSPFMGDIKKMWSLLTTIHSRIDFLRKTYGKRTRISASKVVHSTAHPSTRFSMSEWDGGENNFLTISCKSMRHDVRASGYLYHTLSHLDGIDGELRGIFGALGLNNPIASIWESLPYSFAVDWFLNVGGRIKRLAIPPFPGTWTIQDPTFTVKSTYSLELRHEFDPVGVYGQGLQAPLSQTVSGSASCFVRYNYFPLNWLDVSEPTPNQLVLMLALFGSSQ